MNLKKIENCPIGPGGKCELYSNIEDYFFNTPGSWCYYKDSESGHLWLSPRPDDESIPELYSEYYTHDGAASLLEPTLWERAINYSLHKQLGYSQDFTAGIREKFFTHLPTVARAAIMEVAKLPASTTGNLLDFGCGNANFMRRMEKSGWSVCGIEPDIKAVDKVKSAYGYDVRKNLDSVADWMGYFDVIVVNHVIEHIVDPVETLRELSKLLTAGGKIIITTPNAKSLGARLFRKYWRGMEAPRHLNIFTIESLQHALTDSGFSIGSVTTETRLARGIFFTSYFAWRTRKRIELNPINNRLVKLFGYCYQVVEGVMCVFFPWFGEEIYCCAIAQ